MISQIYTLKPLDEGAEPATFYAPLGCVTSEGQLYRRSDEGEGVDRELRAIWEAQEMWRVEVCFFSATDGLSGWKRFAPSMGRGWFVPVAAEAVPALSAYMDELKPVRVLKQRLEHKEGSLASALLRLGRLNSAGKGSEDVSGMSADQRHASGRVTELESEITRIASNLEAAEVARLKAQTVLLTALGWEGLLEATKGGKDNG